jgi:hypothetical protein
VVEDVDQNDDVERPRWKRALFNGVIINLDRSVSHCLAEPPAMKPEVFVRKRITAYHAVGGAAAEDQTCVRVRAATQLDVIAEMRW